MSLLSASREVVKRVKKIEYNGFTATVTNGKVKWEIPISNLINAFYYCPMNIYEDEEDGIKIKRGKRQEFAEYVARKMLDEANQDTGASYIEEALDKVFEEAYESGCDFIKYPDEEYDD
jgi:hypothetical protein